MPPVALPQGQFDAFLTDLTDYLNSSDYTQEFIRDSLRQGETLCIEARGVCSGEAIVQLTTAQEQLAAEMQALDERLAAVDRLLGVDWSATFELIRTEDAKAVTVQATTGAATLVADLRQALDAWRGTDDSLLALADAHWNPLLTRSGQGIARESRERLHRLLGNNLGGAEPAAAVMSDLHLAGFRLTPAAEAARRALDEPCDETAYLTAIKPEEIPVRKSLADWLLFRRIQTVRRRLFGADSTQAIPAAIKEQRLTDPAREAFGQMIDRTVKEKFPALPIRYSEALLTTYVTRFRDIVLEQLRGQRELLVQERADRQAPFDQNERILTSIRELKDTAAQLLTDIDALMRREAPQAIAPGTAPIPEAERAAPPVALECTAA